MSNKDLLDKAANEIENDKNLLDKAANEIENDKNLLDKAANEIENDKNLLDKAANEIENDQNLLDKATNEIENDKDLLDKATNEIKQGRKIFEDTTPKTSKQFLDLGKSINDDKEYNKKYERQKIEIKSILEKKFKPDTKLGLPNVADDLYIESLKDSEFKNVYDQAKKNIEEKEKDKIGKNNPLRALFGIKSKKQAYKIVNGPLKALDKGAAMGFSGLAEFGANVTNLAGKAGEIVHGLFTFTKPDYKKSLLGDLENYLRGKVVDWRKYGEPGLNDSTVEKIFHSIGRSTEALKYINPAMRLGTIPGMATTDAISHIHEGPKEAAIAAGKGALFGTALKTLQPATTTQRIAGMSSLGAATTISEGGSGGDILASAITYGMLGSMNPKQVKKLEREGLYKIYKEQAGNFFDRSSESKLFSHYDALKTMKQKDEYRVERGLYKGGLYKIQQVGDKIFNELKKQDKKINFTKQEQAEAYKFFTEKNADPKSIKNKVLRNRLQKIKTMIDEVGNKLVKSGMLDKETYEANKGQYLPRVYLKHLLGEKTFEILSSGNKSSIQAYLKKRKDLSPEIRAMLGEIKYPAFLASKAFTTPMQDLATFDFLGKIAKNPSWAYANSLIRYNGKTVSLKWLKDEVSKISNTIPHLKGETKLKVERQVLDLTNQIKKIDSKIDPIKLNKDYRQVPDSPRYGSLRGMFLRKEIYYDLGFKSKHSSYDPGLAEKILGQGIEGTKTIAKSYHRIWKTLKVPFNPPGQVRNMISNLGLIHMSGVPMARIPDTLVRSLNDIIKDKGSWTIFKKYGGKDTTFTKSELIKFRNDLDLLKIEGEMHPLIYAKRLGARLADMPGNAYQFIESWYKTAKIMDSMNREGKTERQAVVEANKWLFDYSEVPKSIKFLRDYPIGSAFITYQYKVLPRIIETAAKRPHKFLPYLSIVPIIHGFIENNYNDVSKEDFNKLKKLMPDFLKETGHGMFLPWKDEYGRWQPVNLEYFFPWGQWQSVAHSLTKGDVGTAIRQTGLGNGPIVGLISSFQSNKDTFTKRPIWNESDSASKQLKDKLLYIWNFNVPPWITEKGFVGKMNEAINKKVDPYTGKQLTTINQAIGRLFGFNIYPFHPEEQRQKIIYFKTREIKDIHHRMGSRIRSLNREIQHLRGKEKEEKIKQREKSKNEYMEAIRQKQDEIKKFREETK